MRLTGNELPQWGLPTPENDTQCPFSLDLRRLVRGERHSWMRPSLEVQPYAVPAVMCDG